MKKAYFMRKWWCYDENILLGRCCGFNCVLTIIHMAFIFLFATVLLLSIHIKLQWNFTLDHLIQMFIWIIRKKNYQRSPKSFYFITPLLDLNAIWTLWTFEFNNGCMCSRCSTSEIRLSNPSPYSQMSNFINRFFF